MKMFNSGLIPVPDFICLTAVAFPGCFSRLVKQLKKTRPDLVLVRENNFLPGAYVKKIRIYFDSCLQSTSRKRARTSQIFTSIETEIYFVS